ncbi:MAG TPA: DUF3461 family protein [Gammaproteobacteria bacterium]|nr:DUF3461 family protein [Gammaproteobacteria bacterium]
MSDYPNLLNMGITHPEEISKFAIYTVGNTDILQITYERKKGSLLAESRRYKFPQVKKTVMVDGGTDKAQSVFESTPAFRDALHELEQLKLAREQGKDKKAAIIDEIRLLEEEVAWRLEYIRTLTEKL